MSDNVVAYKNRNTDQVVAFPEPNSRFEALDEWERVDADQVSYTVADLHDRAAAERESIEGAAAIRLDSVQGAAAAGIAAAQVVNTGAESGVVPAALPTLSTGDAGEKQQPVPILAKSDALRDTVTTPFEDNKRRADEEIAHPPRDGVLARAKRDHKTGATQIGENPEEHAGVKPARVRKANHDAGTVNAGTVHNTTDTDTAAAGGKAADTVHGKTEDKPK